MSRGKAAGKGTATAVGQALVDIAPLLRKQQDRIIKIINTRARGRPKTRAQIAGYAEQHGVDATARKFNVTVEWVGRCLSSHGRK